MAFMAKTAALLGCCALLGLPHLAKSAQRRKQTDPYLAKDCYDEGSSDNLYAPGAFNVSNIHGNETIAMEDYKDKVISNCKLFLH